VLWRTRGDRTRQPVIFCGSVERTSFAEKDETKGFVVLELGARAQERGRLRFFDLPARPMLEDPRRFLGPSREGAYRGGAMRSSTSTP
jgi:DNA repair exonuclease SbcCD nuclease subunit